MITRRAALLAALLAPAIAGAADLELSPISIELSDATRTALVTLRNSGGAPLRYQLRAYAWGQQDDGQMQLTPTREIVLFPPLVELAPGETRNVRVGAQVAAGVTERTWRVFIEELPRAEDAAAASRVQVLTRIGVPVFLAPKRRVERGEVAFLAGDAKRLRFAVKNTGTVRLRPNAITLALVGADGKRLAEKTLDAWYVLAGGERIYEADVPADVCASAAEAVASVALEGGAIEQRIAGPCRAP
jgi:fimbrial chaperone protein